MKPETIQNAKSMLVMLLERGASYAEAGKPFDLVRSTVERNVKALLRQLVANGSIKGLDEDGLTSFALVRKASREVLAALDGHEPGPWHRFPAMLTEAHLEQASARVRRRSQNASRDMALIAVLYQTGAKPVELARLQVRDCLAPSGSIRTRWHLRDNVAINGLCRPLHLSSPTVRSALDRYFDYRVERRAGIGAGTMYRGLDPCSALFLTSHGRGFEVRPRSARDPRETCPLMTATLRLAFPRAGWPGLTAQAVRRMVACRLAAERASPTKIAHLLGLSSERAVLMLIEGERIEPSAAIQSVNPAPLSAVEPVMSMEIPAFERAELLQQQVA